MRAVLWKREITEIDYLILSHDDADHIGGVAFGGFHGTSFMLGINNVPGDIGDDDLDGIEDWLSADGIFVPDPEELGTDDDVRVLHFVDYGDEIMRDDVVAIEKYQAFANATGMRLAINDQNTFNDFEIDLGSGAIMKSCEGTLRARCQREYPERTLAFISRDLQGLRLFDLGRPNRTQVRRGECPCRRGGGARDSQ